MEFAKLPEELLISRLQPPKPGCRLVLDTDTYNEIDDPYALIYALRSPEVRLEAVYAAPFHNSRSSGPADGMERSYQEILKILELIGEKRPIFRGSDRWMAAPDSPVESPAARDLVERAMASEEPLYVAAIGAPTNVASAILMEPRIREKIVVVWLGGHGAHMPSAREFNLQQDLFASRVLFDSGVPLVQLPCMGVVSHLSVTMPELRQNLTEASRCGKYLLEITEDAMKQDGNTSRVIWDISTIAWLVHSQWCPSGLLPSPILTDQMTYSKDLRRHLIRYVYFVERDPIFNDLFDKMRDLH